MKIFVSRQLDETSPIRAKVPSAVITDRSLVIFSALPFDGPDADWVFFYSRNAVRYFFSAGNYHLYPYQWAALSHGTADELSKYVLDISFVGDGTPESVAKQYAEAINPRDKTCYIRANQSQDSIYKLLGNTSDYSLPVYDNQPIDSVPADSFDILIFTSPLNVSAYYNKRKPNGEQVISIGNTTAKALKSAGITNYTIATEPSEQGLADCLSVLNFE